MLLGGDNDLAFDGGSDSIFIINNTGAATGRTYFASNTSAESLTITNAGNVGIGTATPAKKLSLFTTTVGDGILIDGSTTNGVAFARDGIEYGAIGVAAVAGHGSQDSVPNDLVIRTGGGVGITGSRILFASNNLGDVTFPTKMTIANDGNVGIGTTTPVMTLDVVGGVKTGDPPNGSCTGGPSGTGGSTAGTIRWHPADNELQYCDGSVWQSITVKTLPATCIPGDTWTGTYKACSCGFTGSLIWEGTQTCTCESDGITWNCVNSCPPAPPGAGC